METRKVRSGTVVTLAVVVFTEITTLALDETASARLIATVRDNL